MSAALSTLAVLSLLAAGWLALLALLARAHAAPAGAPPPLFFDLLVPAHDEEAGIAETLRSLRALDWPPELRRILVIADNCSDRTAEVAAAEGAWVLRRDEPARRGKGHALALGFSRSLADGRADAVLVIDADSSVSPGLLRACALRLGAGARAIQVASGVRNATASWRTELLAVALAAFNGLRARGLSRLGLSCGLRGDGMCLSRAALLAVPYRATSPAEDVEHGLDLAEAGIAVACAPEALVLSDAPTSAAAAEEERRRWEGGRRALVRRAPRLLWLGLRRRDPSLLALAVDLLIPPLSTLALADALGLGLSLALHRALIAGAFALALLLLVAHALLGWALSGTGARGLAALAHLPAYFWWKARLALGIHPPPPWSAPPRAGRPA